MTSSFNKPINFNFIILFNLNIIKNFIGLVIFIILIQNQNYKLKLNFFSIFNIFTFLILLNFYETGFISSSLSIFKSTNGYNLIGLISGLIFYSIFFLNENNLNKIKLIIH